VREKSRHVVLMLRLLVIRSRSPPCVQYVLDDTATEYARKTAPGSFSRYVTEPLTVC
jgi:hypothetical protein